MNLYQTGALNESQCATIAGALALLLQHGDIDEDRAEAEALRAQFADPATHFIQLDVEA